MAQFIRAGAVSQLPFSSAVVAGNLIFVSGQASVDSRTGSYLPDSFEGEMRRSFENLLSVLKSVECDFSRLVSVRCYVDSQDQLAEFNAIYRDIIQPPYPARTTLVGVLGKDFLKFEVDAVACGGQS